jgi:hypothetical protein
MSTPPMVAVAGNLRHLERRRHHADDRQRRAVHGQRLADCRRILVVALPPELVTQRDDRLLVPGALSFAEQPSALAFKPSASKNVPVTKVPAGAAVRSRR